MCCFSCKSVASYGILLQIRHHAFTSTACFTWQSWTETDPLNVRYLPPPFLCWRQSASQEEGYDKVDWTSDVETHPPWLRFHLGISRWELYNRKDPNMAGLTHYLATQRILSAGKQMRGGRANRWEDRLKEGRGQGRAYSSKWGVCSEESGGLPVISLFSLWFLF